MRKSVIIIFASVVCALIACTSKVSDIFEPESITIAAHLDLTEGDTYTLNPIIRPSNLIDVSLIWSSSSPSVAAVDQKGTVSALHEGTATITVASRGSGISAFCDVIVSSRTIAITDINLDHESLDMIEGDCVTLVATISPENATDRAITWSSSNTSVASVDQSGNVVALTAGNTVIKAATQSGNISATCPVTVSSKIVHVTEVSVIPTSLTLDEGESYDIVATVIPSDATNKNLIWSSTATSVATVDQSGKVHALKVGSAIIKATSEENGMYSSCYLTVNSKVIPVTGVSLNQTDISLTEGETTYLTATISPANATNHHVSWSSSAPAVASVDGDGRVSAMAAGTAVITVTTDDGGKTATCSVTVKPKTVSVTGISLDRTSVTLLEGETTTIVATVYPSNATNKSTFWYSSNPTVASVDGNGVVSAMTAGTAVITVTTDDGGKTATCTVTVNPKTIAVTGVSLDRACVTLLEGDAATLVATVYPSNATNKNVSWNSSNPSVASVDKYGMVTALRNGASTITVETEDGGWKSCCEIVVKQSGLEDPGYGDEIDW